MSAAIRQYRDGDILKFKSRHAVGINRETVEPDIASGEAFTFYEKETGLVLGCFGGVVVPGEPIAAVWLDISAYMQERYSLFLVRTIKRHRDHAHKRYGISRFITNIEKDDTRSMDWIDMLGFERVPELDDAVPGSYVYARAV